MAEDFDFFMVFQLDDSGDRVRIDVPEEDLQSALHPEEVFVIVKEELRRIFIWKGAKSPVRKRFISSRVASGLQEEVVKVAAFHRPKIVSVDQGDEPVEFLRAFGLESMEVTERLEDMRYVRNIEKEAPGKFGTILDEDGKKEEKEEEEYFSPALQELQKKGKKIDIDSIGGATIKKSVPTPTTKARPAPASQPSRTYVPYPSKPSGGAAGRTVGMSQEQQKKLMDKILENDVPDNFKRLNLIVGTTLFGAVSKKSSVFGKEVETTEWQPVTDVPEGPIEINDHKVRVYFDADKGIVEAVEILAQDEDAPKKAPAKETPAKKEPEAEPDREVDLKSMTVKNLKTYASEHDIELASNLKKAEIIKTIKESEEEDKPKSGRRPLPKIPTGND